MLDEAGFAKHVQHTHTYTHTKNIWNLGKEIKENI